LLAVRERKPRSEYRHEVSVAMEKSPLVASFESPLMAG
jgi:hypothetical protein